MNLLISTLRQFGNKFFMSCPVPSPLYLPLPQPQSKATIIMQSKREREEGGKIFDMDLIGTEILNDRNLIITLQVTNRIPVNYATRSSRWLVI